VNDELTAPNTKYVVLDLLGQGTFGQVFRCQDCSTRKIVAIKVVKNKPAYRNQAMIEIQVRLMCRYIQIYRSAVIKAC
jgi:dual specificity protein kinase YAK1